MASNRFTMHLYTQCDISDIFYAQKVLAYCEEAGIHWEKVDYKEPLRNTFDQALYCEYWTKAHKAGFVNAITHEYGGVLCSCGRGSVSLNINWFRGTTRYSTLCITMSYKMLQTKRAQFDELFLKLLDLLKPDHAYIANENFWFRCCRNSLDGPTPYRDIHWITFISHEKLVQVQGDVTTLPWSRRQDVDSGVVFWMCDHIPKDGDEVEDKCLSYRLVIWNRE